MTVMLPRFATFVEFSEDATEFVAAETTFVWAKAALPQDNATDEMTAKYILQFLFFLSAKLFINFKGLNFQNISANLYGLTLCKTPCGVTQEFG
jgi:hypothetical protein